MSERVRGWSRGIAAVAAIGLLSAGGAFAQETEQTKRADIYDEQADAKVQIAEALVKAKKDNKRVLIQWGANWCGWCHLLHGVFEGDAETRRTLLYEYEVVLVDVGRFDKHMDVAASYGAEIKGIPFLTILDSDGEVIINQNTGDLEDGPKHDLPKVRGFLDANKPEPLVAKAVMADALARAKAEDKTAFLHFGAPWCVWCHRLEDWMAKPDVAKLLNKDFVDLKIDEDRMTGARDIKAKYQDSGGIPWIGFLNPQGELLIGSTGPKGNVGFPVKPHEIEHFMAMLKKAAKRLTAEDLAYLEKSLKESAKVILGGS